jgi:cellulose synthase/poly-beta-1,6-N-acetylglucosamine synthase-like glycosyltransferase
MSIALIAGVVIFVYPFVIYPAILLVLARGRRPEPIEPVTDPPNVALVICALNEQKIIRQKVENSLALRYPKEKLRLVFISDGSTDDTADIIREYEAAGVQLIEHRVRRGKIANLNETLAVRQEDILVLSDANVIYHPDALLYLVARFRDPSVGCVSGKVILTDTTPALGAPTESYYSLEWLLQGRSSAIYSMVGTDGAMYALRRELFRPCPNDTLIEDLVIAMEIIRLGYRVVFEPRALGWEQGPASLREEFRRKVRIAAGSAQALLRGNAWPRHCPWRYWFIFISHKLLRWLSPVTGAVVLLLAVLTARQATSQLVLGGFLAASGLALLRWVTGWNNPVLSAPFYFVFGQVALAVGLAKGIAGKQNVLWAKTDR